MSSSPLPVSPEVSPPDDPFAPYLKGPAPRILREIPLPEGEQPDLWLQGVVYSAPAANASGSHNEVYAIIARPRQGTVLPGLLLLHGGEGCADLDRAKAWARKGFVVVAPELPGIAHPDKAIHSQGAWKQGAYGSGRWTASPDITASTIFQGVAAALQSFHLLRDQPGVNLDRTGILGISWGGYTTTMVAALAGDRVAAAFSVYGCGFYEHTTAQTPLAGMPPAERALWFEFLDAGRRAGRITAPYFIAAASNDFFFWPPAVQATLDALPGDRNQLYSPNDNHKLNVPGGSAPGDNWAEMAGVFLAHHLQSATAALPRITVLSVEAPRVRFYLESSHPVTALAAYYSLPADTWAKRAWQAVETIAIPGQPATYEAVLPAEAWDGGAGFILASDDRPVSVSSRLLLLTR